MRCAVCGADMLLRRTTAKYSRFRYVEDQGDRMWWEGEELPDLATVVAHEAICDSCGHVVSLELTSEGFKVR